MAETLHISRVVPTPSNAKAILSLTRAELAHSGVTSELIEANANPDNAAQVKKQLKKLLYGERYLALVAKHGLFTKKILGFVKYHEWQAADQLPYAPRVERELLQQMIDIQKHHLAHRPLGIFSFIMHSALPRDEQLRGASALLYEVISKHREVRIGLASNNPLRSVLTENDFRPTGMTGEPIPGLEQELYIRSAHR